MAFSEVCEGHDACPLCGATAPKLGQVCCAASMEIGFWDEVDAGERGKLAHWMWFHTNDDCAKGGEES